MKLFSQMSRPLISLGLKVRSRKWPEDYYIYREEKKLMDSIVTGKQIGRAHV